MTGYVLYFFFSYSRDDAVDLHLDEFFKDLSREVAIRGSIRHGDPGFLDRNQPPGVEWSTHTGAALSACNVFVPLFSPNYFTSPYCGREWYAFTARLAAHRKATGESLASIVPVWWVPPFEDLPANAGRLQDTRDRFGPEYRKYGLRFLRQLKENRDRYTQFLVEFTELVLTAGRTPPAEVEPVDLASLPDAFAVDPKPPGPTPRPIPVGGAGTKKRVNFVVVAAGHDRMRAIRTASLDIYGDDWDDWRPYHPGCPDPIALRAQGVAMAQQLLSLFRPADQDLFDLLDAAQRHRELVVLIIDPWAVELPEYGPLLTRLNGLRYGNTAIVVPWEEAGPDSTIRDGLYLLLENWTDTGDQMFRDDIRSMAEFETKLAQVLVEIRSRILRKAEVARRVRETGPTARPLLTGPGS